MPSNSRAATLSPADYLVDGCQPTQVARPASIDELARALGDADAARQAVVFQGGRTGIGIGNPPRRYDLAVDCTALDSVVDFQPDDFTATVQPGLTLATLQRTLAEHGQFVPLDVPHPQRATVGGCIARGRGGLRRGRFGVVRDWLIGAAFVLPDGTRIKAGGRVVKNVSGFDLPKLFAGSFGTLGCIVEATFKLRPLPIADATLVQPCADFAAACDLSARVCAALPGAEAIALLDEQSARRASVGTNAAVAVRVAGVEEAVAAALDALAGLPGVDAEPAPTDPARWQRLVDLEAPPPGDDVRPTALLRIGLPPAALPGVAITLRHTYPGARIWAYADGGLLFAGLPPLDTAALHQGIQAMRNDLAPRHGVVTVDVVPPDAKPGLDVWGDAGDGLAIMREIKRRFDPNDTCSPGRFVGGI